MDQNSKLQISFNKRFFQFADGTPFFYMADTAWEMFHRLSMNEIEFYFDSRKVQGYNVIQAVLIPEMDGLRTPNVYGQLPFTDQNADKPNPEYFDFVELVLHLAEAKDMFLALVPTWGDKIDKIFGIGPELFNEVNAYNYGVWLGNRFSSVPNLIWINGGDRSGGGDNFAIWDALGKGIKSADPNHLMTFHPLGDASSSMWFHHAEWLDFNVCQSGHSMRNYPNHMMISYDYLRQPAKPCLDMEPRYEEHAVNWNADKNGIFTDYDVRQAAYWAVFAGACGHAYGTHPVWQMYDIGREPIGYIRSTWKEALQFTGASQLIHLKNLMLSRSYFDRIPFQSILKVPKVGEEHIRCTGGNSYLMCYLPLGGTLELEMRRIPWQKSKASWFNPRTGQSEPIGIFLKNDTGSFTAPSSGVGNDWVMVLDEVQSKQE
ncbi:MAG: glycoside hydrolase family 140 protein [Bacteroidota bacterium]